MTAEAPRHNPARVDVGNEGHVTAGGARSISARFDGGRPGLGLQRYLPTSEVEVGTMGSCDRCVGGVLLFSLIQLHG